jgi:leucyl/phenylalanyl-tRNA--protein transferase
MMPIFQLGEQIVFPPVELSTKEGILAVGGDLSTRRLITAYKNGIFPWYSDGEPILWWSPDPRFVLFTDELYVSKTMRQVLNREIFTVKFDTAFREVITACKKTKRKRERGTWITDDMLEAYCNLNELGYAHSIEAWSDGKLAGGLYGISLGGCFFGESMFSARSNASKAALIVLTRKLNEHGFMFIDSQVYTEHMESMGARDIPRDEYITLLKKGLKQRTILGSWRDM